MLCNVVLIITDYARAGVTRNNMNKCVVIGRDTETLIYSSIFTSLYYIAYGYGIISPSCYANYFLLRRVACVNICFAQSAIGLKSICKEKP